MPPLVSAHRLHPLTRKGEWQQLSVFLIVPSQQFAFVQANQIAGICACILATLAIPVHTDYVCNTI